MYISSINQAECIPKCEECNSERQFEFQVDKERYIYMNHVYLESIIGSLKIKINILFQIMPQLINYLDFEDPLNSLDWGIIAIFTCKKSCVPKAGYVSEWVWKQDIVENETAPISKMFAE